MSQKRNAPSKKTDEDIARNSTMRRKHDTSHDNRSREGGGGTNRDNPRRISIDAHSPRTEQNNKSFGRNKGGYGPEQNRSWRNPKGPPDLGHRPPSRQRSGKGKISYYWPDVSKQLERFTFFWRADSPFSQHHAAKFKLDEMTFNCSEQYYMFQKAIRFGDHHIAKEIMDASNPAKQKSIAKGVCNFEQEIWDNISYDIVKRANIAKFSQNERLLNLLVATRGTELVEASPGDRKWGIGLAADQADALRKETWRGENKLGRILTEIRDGEFSGYGYGPEKILHDKYYGYMGFCRSSSPFNPRHLAPFSTDQASYVSLFHYLMYECTELFEKKHLTKKISETMNQNTICKIAYSEQINEQIWKIHLKKFLIKGNFYKFSDNPNLKALLLNTNGKVLVYQSDDDEIGSGTEESSDIGLLRSNWKKENHLGLILTFMRDEWIRNPYITLDALLHKDVPLYSWNFTETDLMHMRKMEPPSLPTNLERLSENAVQGSNQNKKSTVEKGMKGPCQTSAAPKFLPTEVTPPENLCNQEFGGKKVILSNDTKDPCQVTPISSTLVASSEIPHNHKSRETTSTCTSLNKESAVPTNPNKPCEITSERSNRSVIGNETQISCETQKTPGHSNTKVVTSSKSTNESPNKIEVAVSDENKDKHPRAQKQTSLKCKEEEMVTTRGAVEGSCEKKTEARKKKERKKKSKANKKLKSQA